MSNFKISYALILVVFLTTQSCKESEKDGRSNDEHILNQNKVVQKEAQLEDSKGESIRWFEPESLDTAIKIGDRQITLQHTDSIYFDEYFIPNRIRDSLTSGIYNSHERALKIEQYLLQNNHQYAKRDSNGLHLKLEDDTWKLLDLNEMTDEADNVFEHFFKDFGFYSVYVQWGEGSGHKVINSTTGEVTHLIGRPFFSPKGDYVIALNEDIEAGFSRNGIQIFINENGKLKQIAYYEPQTWGPYSAKWLDDHTVILKNRTVEITKRHQRYLNFYSKLQIEKKS